MSRLGERCRRVDPRRRRTRTCRRTTGGTPASTRSREWAPLARPAQDGQTSARDRMPATPPRQSRAGGDPAMPGRRRCAEELRRAEAPMSNLDTVKAIYEAFGRGDVPAILDVVADDCEWEAWSD